MKKIPIRPTKTRRFHALLEDLMLIASHFAWNAA